MRTERYGSREPFFLDTAMSEPDQNCAGCVKQKMLHGDLQKLHGDLQKHFFNNMKNGLMENHKWITAANIPLKGR